MGGSGVSEEFSPPRLARLLHALPHVNVTLHRVNDTFAPHSPVYLEVRSLHARLKLLNFTNDVAKLAFHWPLLFPRLQSLGIIGSIPGAWLIVTLTILLIYLLTRCCDRKQRPPRSITALKVPALFYWKERYNKVYEVCRCMFFMARLHPIVRVILMSYVMYLIESIS